jgi:hypothetical protein
MRYIVFATDPALVRLPWYDAPPQAGEVVNVIEYDPAHPYAPPPGCAIAPDATLHIGDLVPP